MRHYWFPIRKRGIFRPGKEIEGLRGGVRWYAAQAKLKIDTTRAEKDRFRMETIYASVIYLESCVETRDFLKRKRPEKVVKNARTLISLILRMSETLAGTGRGRFPGIAVSGNVPWKRPVAPLFSLADSDKNRCCKGMIWADAHCQSALLVDRDGVFATKFKEDSRGIPRRKNKEPPFHRWLSVCLNSILFNRRFDRRHLRLYGRSRCG
jgi:hypothetical protein